MLVPSHPGYPRPSRGAQALEIALLLVLFVPITALAVLVVGGSAAVASAFVRSALALIVRDAAFVVLVVLLVRRDGQPVAALGWELRGWLREALIGIGAFPILLAFVALLGAALRAAGVPSATHVPPSFLPEQSGQLALAAVLVAVVAVSEETVFRGFLLPRLRAVTGSTPAAVVISSALFATGHAYEGVTGVLVVGAVGVALALVYLWRGTLVAVVVLHFLQDFLGIVLVPALHLR